MIVYVDMDDVLCDFTGAKNEALQKNPKVGYPQSQFGFYQNLKPIEGAIDAIKFLINSKSYDPYILTAPSIHNPFSYTEKRVWVENHFGFQFVEKLIICSNKSLLNGSILIDDNESGKGQDKFIGKFIHFGSSKFPNWKTVLKELQDEGRR